jgi:hypothetical protein
MLVIWEKRKLDEKMVAFLEGVYPQCFYAHRRATAPCVKNYEDCRYLAGDLQE